MQPLSAPSPGRPRLLGISASTGRVALEGRAHVPWCRPANFPSGPGTQHSARAHRPRRRGGGKGRLPLPLPPSPMHLPERTRLRREAVGTGNTEDKPRPPATPQPRLTRGRRFTHIRDQCQEAWARRRPPGVLFAWLWVTNVTGGLRGWFGHRPKGAEGRDMGPGMLPGIS